MNKEKHKGLRDVKVNGKDYVVPEEVIDNNCPYCEGTGKKMVQNGLDDYNQEVCDCQKEFESEVKEMKRNEAEDVKQELAKTGKENIPFDDLERKSNYPKDFTPNWKQ